MNEKENNFENLKRLLKLKQHEIPPPGYFNHFSGNVISRLRAGEASGSRHLMERLESDSPWLKNFLRIFESRPGIIGGFATSLCLLLVLAVVFADRPEKVSKDLLTLSTPATATATGTTVASMSAPVLAASPDASGIVASTNPVTSLQPVATLFGQPGAGTLFQPAGFAPANQNQ